MKKKILIISIISIIFLISSFLLYSRFIGTKGLIVKEYKIESSTITENFHGLKIVHFSDLHYGTIINKKELTNLVNQINFIKPDIVVFTGDLIDRDTKIYDQTITDLTNELKRIDVTINKYAVSGNHDVDKGINNFNKIMNDSGFIILNNNYDLIYNNDNNPIIIVGSSSNSNDQVNIDEKLNDSIEYIKNTPNIKYKILLLHEPDYVDKIDINNFDLVLAGHSHNGQIRLPFIGALVTPAGSKKYYKEYYKINNTDMFISSGLGTSVVKFRFLDKPSINLYRLVKK